MRFIRTKTGYVAVDFIAEFTGIIRHPLNGKLVAQSAVLKDREASRVVFATPVAMEDGICDTIIPAAPNLFVTAVIECHTDSGKMAELERVPIIAWRISAESYLQVMPVLVSEGHLHWYLEREDGSYDDCVDQIFITKEELIEYHTRLMNPAKAD